MHAIAQLARESQQIIPPIGGEDFQGVGLQQIATFQHLANVFKGELAAYFARGLPGHFRIRVGNDGFVDAGWQGVDIADFFGLEKRESVDDVIMFFAEK